MIYLARANRCPNPVVEIPNTGCFVRIGIIYSCNGSIGKCLKLHSRMFSIFRLNPIHFQTQMSDRWLYVYHYIRAIYIWLSPWIPRSMVNVFSCFFINSRWWFRAAPPRLRTRIHRLRGRVRRLKHRSQRWQIPCGEGHGDGHGDFDRNLRNSDSCRKPWLYCNLPERLKTQFTTVSIGFHIFHGVYSRTCWAWTRILSGKKVFLCKRFRYWSSDSPWVNFNQWPGMTCWASLGEDNKTYTTYRQPSIEHQHKSQRAPREKKCWKLIETNKQKGGNT